MIQMVFATNSGASENRVSKGAISTYLRNRVYPSILLSFYGYILVESLHKYTSHMLMLASLLIFPISLRGHNMAYPAFLYKATWLDKP
jgi:hypothetical protein